jgi:hypothetical protein
VKLSPALADALRARGRRVGSITDAARAALADQFQWYGLPSVIVDLFSEDAKPGQSQRDYVVEVLVHHYDELVRARARREAQHPLRAANE